MIDLDHLSYGHLKVCGKDNIGWLPIQFGLAKSIELGQKSIFSYISILGLLL